MTTYLVAQAVAMCTVTGLLFVYMCAVNVRVERARCSSNDKANSTRSSEAFGVSLQRRLSLLACALAVVVGFDFERARAVLPLGMYLVARTTLEASYMNVCSVWVYLTVRALCLQLRRPMSRAVAPVLAVACSAYWALNVSLQVVFVSDQRAYRWCYVLAYTLSGAVACGITWFATYHALALRALVMAHVARLERVDRAVHAGAPIPPPSPTLAAGGGNNKQQPGGGVVSSLIVLVSPVAAARPSFGAGARSGGGLNSSASPAISAAPISTTATTATPPATALASISPRVAPASSTSSASAAAPSASSASGIDTRDLRDAMSRLSWQLLFVNVIVLFLAAGVVATAVPRWRDLTLVDDAVANPSARTFGLTTVAGWALLLLALWPCWLSTPGEWRAALTRCCYARCCCGGCCSACTCSRCAV